MCQGLKLLKLDETDQFNYMLFALWLAYDDQFVYASWKVLDELETFMVTSSCRIGFGIKLFVLQSPSFVQPPTICCLFSPTQKIIFNMFFDHIII